MREPIEFTAKIVAFLFVAIVVLGFTNFLYEQNKKSSNSSGSESLDLPRSDIELHDMAYITAIGVIIYTILWIFLPIAFAGLFGLIYLIYIMSKMDENNKFLLKQR